MKKLTYNEVRETFDLYNEDLHCHDQDCLKIHLNDSFYGDNELKLVFDFIDKKLISSYLEFKRKPISSLKFETVEQLEEFLKLYPISLEEDLKEKRDEDFKIYQRENKPFTWMYGFK